LFHIFDVPQQNMLFNFSFNRYSSIIHTRLCLNVRALNYYLFKIGCKPSPECFCGFEVDSINHYFLHCPLFAAPRLKLLSSAAYIFAHRWHAITETQLISVFLSGTSQISEENRGGSRPMQTMRMHRSKLNVRNKIRLQYCRYVDKNQKENYKIINIHIYIFNPQIMIIIPYNFLQLIIPKSDVNQC
jgi:hypothetical protein